MFSSRNAAATFAAGLAAVTLGTLMSVPGGSAAYAATTSSTSVKPKAENLASLQAKGEKAIDLRTAQITKLLAKVNASKNLTTAHRFTLTTLLNTDQSNLGSLRAKVAADTDRTTLVSDVKSIVTDYRVFVLVDPKVHVTDAADSITSISAKEDAEATTLQAKVAQLNAAGKDTAAISANLTQAQADAQAAASAVAGQAEAVLALQATDYPNNQAAKDSAIAAVKSARTQVTNSRAALKSAESAIKALKGAK